MKRCLTCDTGYDSAANRCPNCHFEPAMVDGFEAYASEYANEGGGFKASYFNELARLEDAHFWFRARNRLILWALEKYRPGFRSFFEIGCGTGYVLSGVARHFPGARLAGSEIFVSGLGYAAARLPSVKLMQMDARKIPFDHEFDVVGAFDVLEHIAEDETVLAQLHGALNPGGLLLLTVPQHPWLWSPADEYACHERRYRASDLHRKVENAGFRIAMSTSFVTILLPAMLASRLFQKSAGSRDFDATDELRIAPWMNRLFLALSSLETGLIRLGCRFPIGGSRLIVAEKTETSPGEPK